MDTGFRTRSCVKSKWSAAGRLRGWAVPGPRADGHGPAARLGRRALARDDAAQGLTFAVRAGARMLLRRDASRTIVLVEHRMDVVMAVSDRITVMHQGAVLAEGSPREIAADERVQQAYLGELYDDVRR